MSPVPVAPLLRQLYEASHEIRALPDLGQLIARAAAVVADDLGWGSAVIVSRQHGRDHGMVVGVHGDDEARHALVSGVLPWTPWELLLRDHRIRGGAAIVPRSRAGDVLELLAPWRPAAADLLLVPMRDPHGEVNGVIDVPVAHGRRPTDDDLDAVLTIADMLGATLGNTLRAMGEQDYGVALQQLLAVSARFAEARDTQVILEAICNAIYDALGFLRVAVVLPDVAGRARPVAAVGIDIGDPTIRFDDPIERVALPEQDIFGCYLVPLDGGRATDTDADPWAWRHRLVVPLRDPRGELIGRIWADDPADGLLPPHSRLQALRLFADQAQAAIGAAQQHEQTRHAAQHDSLTGLPNRALLLDRLDQALRRARRVGSTVAVLFVDLDRFKAINDTYGHDAGDMALRTVAGRIDALLRPADTVARLGGDEFVVVCEDIPGSEAAVTISGRLRDALAEPIRLESDDVSLTASVGIALPAGTGDTARGLLRDADVAMYRAKDAGRDGVEIADALTRAGASVRADLERALRSALERDEMRLVWQPIVDLRGGRIDRVEALLRWEHPLHGDVAPLEFIPLAEETGLIHEIGRWVIWQACEQAERWRRRYGASAPTVAVNLSPRQLRDTSIVSELERQMAAHHLPGGVVCAEITEGILLDGGPATARVLARLQQIGVSVELDDFGTGYSSLSSLEQFRVDGLKIDRRFISGHEHDDRGRAVGEALLMMARALGLRATAEGVETVRQLGWLTDLGCEFGQGHLFARPGPARDIEPLFALDRPFAPSATDSG